MKVLFVGSNPSQRSSTTIPFWVDTRSTSILRQWLNKVEQGGNLLESIHFLNVANYATENNRPLKTSEIKSSLPELTDKIREIAPDRIVSLGKTAEKALTLIRLEFYAMPHPSGLNRQLNDPKFVEEKINGLRVYLSPFKVDA